MPIDAFLHDAGIYVDWQYIFSCALLLSPAIISGALFIFSFLKEPRQFRNALYLLAALAWTSFFVILRFGNNTSIVVLIVILLFAPVITAIFLLINTITVVRKNGFSLTSFLPLLMAGFIFLMYFSPILVYHFNPDVRSIAGAIFILFAFEGLWFSFTFVALLLYSWLYRILPRKRIYDYIIIHGAGLNGNEPSPLLAGRIDKALELWNHQNQHGKFIVSGGQGTDEVVSEAQAMHDYLLKKGVPNNAILMEDKSTTTMENLQYSLLVIGHDTQRSDYTTAVVTSDFHVFRCAEYAHKLKLKADGVGSHTRGWYWPTAFIREFIAITKSHLWPYYTIAALWATIQILHYLMTSTGFIE